LSSKIKKYVIKKIYKDRWLARWKKQRQCCDEQHHVRTCEYCIFYHDMLFSFFWNIREGYNFILSSHTVTDIYKESFVHTLISYMDSFAEIIIICFVSRNA